MAKNGKFILGALVGALVGLVFAPRKGSELRKELKKEISKGGYGEKTLQHTAKLMGQDMVETGKEVYNDPEIQKTIKHGRREAMKFADQAKSKIQESGEEWVKIAKDKLMESKKDIEKEARKAIDTIQKNAKPLATQEGQSKLKKAIKKAIPKKK